MSEELRECPFCGSKPTYTASCRDGFIGTCSIYCQCGAGMSGYETKGEVKKAWNTRTPIEGQNIGNQVEQLRECLQEFVDEIECYCSDMPKDICPIHRAKDILNWYKVKGVKKARKR